MSKIVSGLFITLDGVVEAPGSADTTLPEKRGWSDPYMSPEIGMSIYELIQNSQAFLLGRRTYQDFAAFWPSMPADDPFGQVMNSMPKYVLSRTLDSAEWNNSTLLRGMEDISRLKREPGKDISITGSPTLVRSLLEQGLLDEIQFMVCPVVLGVGKRLFPEGERIDTKALKLVNTKAFDTGMVLLSYEPIQK
jgi:dihydrofolate reductase